MTITIKQVLHPLFIVCFIMGLGAYPMKQANPKIRWIAYLSILYRLTIWFSYIYLLYYTVTLFTWKILCPFIVDRIIIMINTFIAITSVILSFCHQKKFETILKKFTAVDDTLEELGVSKMYQKIHTRSKLVIIGWIVYSLASNFCDTMWWITLKETNSWGLLLAHILNHSIHINAFVNLLFIFLLWHLHLELCRIARELNFMFGIQITFEMVIYLIYITDLSYGLWLLLMKEFKYEFQSSNVWFNISFWCFVYLIKLYAINYICESVMIKANKINKVIHQLTNTLQYVDVYKEIYQFTLQTMHHPLKFTGMGLFYLGNECFRKFFMTIVMFVIIMVQMKVYIGQERK